jgi:hypothetical protein
VLFCRCSVLLLAFDTPGHLAGLHFSGELALLDAMLLPLQLPEIAAPLPDSPGADGAHEVPRPAHPHILARASPAAPVSPPPRALNAVSCVATLWIRVPAILCSWVSQAAAAA